MCMFICVCIHVDIYSCIRIHTYTMYMYGYEKYVYIRTCMHACMPRTYIETDIRTNKHAYIYKYMYSYIHTQLFLAFARKHASGVHCHLAPVKEICDDGIYIYIITCACLNIRI